MSGRADGRTRRWPSGAQCFKRSPLVRTRLIKRFGKPMHRPCTLWFWLMYLGEGGLGREPWHRGQMTRQSSLADARCSPGISLATPLPWTAACHWRLRPGPLRAPACTHTCPPQARPRTSPRQPDGRASQSARCPVGARLPSAPRPASMVMLARSRGPGTLGTSRIAATPPGSSSHWPPARRATCAGASGSTCAPTPPQSRGGERRARLAAATWRRRLPRA